MSKLYVQYGCGLCAPITWVNFDSSPSLIVSKIPILNWMLKKYLPPFPSNVRYGNIVKGLPLKAESTKLIYTSHVLEHLALKDLRIALKNTHRILEMSGTFRLVVPDLAWCINSYLKNPSEIRAYSFMRDTNLGLEKRESDIIGILRKIFGQSSHLWMWDYQSLKIELEAAGFKNIRQVKFNDSNHQAFKDVEDEGRFINSLAIECNK